MTERTTLEKIAASVDDAVTEGLAELNVTADAVEVEVLDAGSRGLLGIGGRQARVRLTIKDPSSEAAAAPVEMEKRQEIIDLPDDGLLAFTQQTVIDLLEKMKISALADAHYGDVDDQGVRPIWVDIHGDDLGVLIGRRAEILNAMQYIVNLIVSKHAGHWVQVTIDVEGYRLRRERQLHQIATRTADQVTRTGNKQSLEPMPANERRIIHIALRDHPTVTTQSIGEEPGRKVTIVPK